MSRLPSVDQLVDKESHEEDRLIQASSSEPDVVEHHPQYRRLPLQRTWPTALMWLAIGITISTLFWMALGPALSKNSTIKANTKVDKTSSISKPMGKYRQDCGGNPEEAATRGCHFQLWSYSWVPEQCFDSDLQQDFLALWSSRENWGYFTKVNGVKEDEVTLWEALAGDRNDLFSTWGQHYWHCAYYQRKFFRVIDENRSMGEEMGSWLTNRDLDEHHAYHCQDWLADPMKHEWNAVIINLTIGYHAC